MHFALDAGTVHHSHHIFHGLASFSRNLGDGVGNLFFTGEAEIRGDVGIVDYFFSICFTTWEAAAPSLRPCQRVEDLLHLRVRFNMKLLGCDGQSDTEEEADTSQRSHTT
jgi:hypothetical protein